MDTSDVQVPKWMRREAASAGDHGGRLWKKGRVSDADGEAPRGAVAEEGAAADASAGGAAEEMEDGAEALQARREEVLKQATTDGISVDPAAIAAMGRDQLEAWAGFARVACVQASMASGVRPCRRRTTPRL